MQHVVRVLALEKKKKRKKARHLMSMTALQVYAVLVYRVAAPKPCFRWAASSCFSH